MKVFVTGGTGYIGNHVARALANARHAISALAHHDEAREALRAAGYETVAGDLARPAGLARAAEGADAVVHAANTNDDDAAAVDDAAVRAMVGALEKAPAGSIQHGIGGHITTGELGEHLGAESMPRSPAREQMGAFTEALALDQRISSRTTRNLLGWEPEGPHILETSL